MAVIPRNAAQERDDSAPIEPLSVDAAATLKLPFLGRMTRDGLIARVRAEPDLAYVLPGTSSIAIGSRWRQRDDIGEIVEVSRGPQRHALLRRLLRAFDDRGVSLVLLDYDETLPNTSFYDAEGFQLLDRIVEFHLQSPRLEHWVPDTDIVRYDPALRDEVMAIERESFPWMWRNSVAEMTSYDSSPHVELYLIRERGRYAGYAGITVNGATVHLDRLAVRRASQGRGLGGRLVAFVIKRAESLEARRLTLSTQHDNLRSQELYQRFGFRRGRWSYDIRGIWLRQPVEVRP